MWTVSELIRWTEQRFAAIGIASPRVDAEYLLADALRCDRMGLYLRFDEVVPPPAKEVFRAHVKRRLNREPVAYIEGKRGFHALGLDLLVDRRVLIPRPETEHLVDWLVEDIADEVTAEILDVGTGSGAIALAIKRIRPNLRVTGTDVSPDALEVARINAEALGLDVRLVEASLLDGLVAPAGGWRAIVANLPYIPSRELEGLSDEVRGFEPVLALDGGSDGLAVVSTLIEHLRRGDVLSADGAVYLEIGAGQHDAVKTLLRAAGFSDVLGRRDYQGIERIIRGRRGL
jgi:release factor glutamine methyltransferase